MASQNVEAPDAGRPVIEVELAQPGIAFVRLLGEHDLTTGQHVADALAAAGARPNVLVDLSECSFMDSSVIHALSRARERVVAAGGRLELIVPLDARFIRRVLAMTYAADGAPLVHDSQVAALASVRAGAHAIEIRDLRARHGNPGLALPDARVDGRARPTPTPTGRDATRDATARTTSPGNAGARSSQTGPEAA